MLIIDARSRCRNYCDIGFAKGHASFNISDERAAYAFSAFFCAHASAIAARALLSPLKAMSLPSSRLLAGQFKRDVAVTIPTLFFY